MNYLTNLILFFTKAFIHDYSKEEIESYLNNQNINYNELFYLSKQNDVDGIIGHYIIKYNTNIDSNSALLFKQSYYDKISLSENQEINFITLYKELLNSKIEIIPFKGFIIRNLYPIKQLRSFGDIDFLIHKSDRKKSHELMKRLNYIPYVNYGSVYSYKKGIEYYEIHDTLIDSDIINNRKLKEYLNTAWNHINQNKEYNTFDPIFDFIYLLSHLAKHILYGGGGIRMFIDLALYIKNKLNEQMINNIISTSEDLCFDVFAKSIIFTTCKWFDIKIPNAIKDFNQIDETTLNIFLEYVINSGIFGKSKNSSGKDIVQNFSQNGNSHPKIAAIKDLFFPSTKKLKTKYTYLNKYPILLPVAWCHRAIINVNLFSKRKQRLKDILTVDKNYINKQNNLFKSIGL